MPVSQGYFFMSIFKKFFLLYFNILDIIYNSFTCYHSFKCYNLYVTFKAGLTQQ